MRCAYCLQQPPFGLSVRRLRCMRERLPKNQPPGKYEGLWTHEGICTHEGLCTHWKHERLRKKQWLSKNQRLTKNRRPLPIHSSNYLARSSPDSPQGGLKSSKE